MPNYRLVANQVGDLLKYDVVLNEIERAAISIFTFQKEEFPNEAITSARAKLVHDWILTLAKQKMTNDERDSLLAGFLSAITPEEHRVGVDDILKNAQVSTGVGPDHLQDFSDRGYHEEVHKHCRGLFVQGNYFHSVFEAAKVYNKLVQQKSNSQKDGQKLMLDVFSLNGVLKLNRGESQTDKNIQDGVRFLSAGLMQALRNPTAHEPALDWPISKKDCLDMLSFISYLLRQLDVAVYFNS